MATLPKSSLDEILNRFALLEHEMSKGPEHEVYTKLAAEYSGLEEVVAAIRTYQKAEQELAEARAILDEPAAGRDMRELAEIEIDELKERLETLTAQIRILLLPKDAADEKGAILEIRAGTGGSEAGLFAGDLFRMYQRYAEMNRWKVEIISASEGEVGGYREVIAAIRGVGVFSRLKFESGVHRVQRVPETESGGRIHTSAATVAVLPEAEDIDVEVKTEDIRIDTMRASGAGGQHVNTTDSAVRLTHLPTGVVVECQDERSQHKNKAKAMSLLKARLLDARETAAHAEQAAERKSMVGSGDRSERIRTYNFPQGRLTDHRINLTLYRLNEIVAGDLDEVIGALLSEHQAGQLAALADGQG